MLVGVTGASGHLGNVICRLLLDNGYKVKGMYHKDNSALLDIVGNSAFIAFQGDMLNAADVNNFAYDCDIIINSAAIISISGDPTGIVFKTNTQGPENLVNACIKSGLKKIIHISSVHAVMEQPVNTPFNESRPYKQKAAFAYDYSKACGEQIILDALQKGVIKGCIIRPSSIIGPYDFKPSEIGKALKDFYNETIPLLPAGGYNFIDVRDVARSIINSINNGKNGQIYLVSGKYYKLKQFAQIIRKVTGKNIPSVVMPFWFLRHVLPFVKIYSRIKMASPLYTLEAITALKNGHPNMVNRKAKDNLGLQCRPLEESIRDFFLWDEKRSSFL